MQIKRSVALVAALMIAGAALAAPAIAKRDGEHGKGRGHGHGKTRPAPTKMRFKLDSHQWDVGSEITGAVTLLTRDGKKWAPLEGAALTVTIRGGEECDAAEPTECVVLPSDCAVAPTDADGYTQVACATLAAGDYVMKVSYAGDETHKKAQRAQGYQVGADDGEEEEDDEVEDVIPTPEPSPTV